MKCKEYKMRTVLVRLSLTFLQITSLLFQCNGCTFKDLFTESLTALLTTGKYVLVKSGVLLQPLK